MKVNLRTFSLVKTATLVGVYSFSNIALAQVPDVPTQQLEEVFVTGSMIKRDNTTSPLPISVFSAEDMKAGGYVNVGDFLKTIPSVGGADFGSQVNNGNLGYSTASLRGLGPNRTLTLLNGKRPTPAGINGFVDLNMLPTHAIERIEVLRDGASSIYGSDAIAGVINIITKTNYEGADAKVQFDVTNEGDGEKSFYGLSIGNSNDRGNVLFSAQYLKQKPIWQKNREFSKYPKGEENGKVIRRGSGVAYPAIVDGKFVLDSATGQPREKTADDTYNYAAASYMVAPQEVYNLFGSANYSINDDTTISSLNAFGQFNFSNRVSEQLMAPVGTFWGANVLSSHPGNAFNKDVIVGRRLGETRGREFTQDANTWNAVFGLDGEFSNGFSWSTALNYGRWADSQVEHGKLNKPRTETLLDDDKCKNDKDCPATWDPFRVNTLTPAMQNYALVINSPVSSSKILQYTFNLTGDFRSLELPGGKPRWAIGYEHRNEKASYIPDGAASLGQIYGVASDATAGGYNVNEVFGEFNFPIISGMTGIYELTFDFATRYTKYNYLSSNSSNKYALNYAPIEDIRFRYTYAEGFRAPNIEERFAPKRQSPSTYNEPCDNWQNSDDPNIRANCAADGLDGDFSITSPQAIGVAGGNPDLQPETSVSQTLGIVFLPSFLENFSVTMDLFNIKIENAIGTIGTDPIITGCYKSTGFPSSPLCALILGPSAVDRAPYNSSPRRDFEGNIAGQSLREENLATFETSGLDFSLNYFFDISTVLVTTNFSGTWLTKYKYEAYEDSGWTQLAGKYGTDPYQGNVSAAFSRVKANFRLGLSQDWWNINWTLRFLSSVDDIDSDPSQLVNDIDGYFYNDLEGAMTFGHLTFSAGIRNLFDKNPPYVTNYDDMNTINFSYDTAGRYFFAGLAFTF